MSIAFLRKIMVWTLYFILLCMKNDTGNSFQTKVKEPRVQTRLFLANPLKIDTFSILKDRFELMLLFNEMVWHNALPYFLPYDITHISFYKRFAQNYQLKNKYYVLCQTRVIRTPPKRRYLRPFCQTLAWSTYSTSAFDFAKNHRK